MTKQLFAGLLFVFGLTFTGCSSDEAMLVDISSSQELSAVAKRGTWRISNYNDSGVDETADYNGYNFVFDDGGVLTASNGVTTINGTWSVTVDSSNGQNELDFNIAFTTPENFEELSDDWDILVTNTDKIDLIDVSGGSGETDSLTFVKNL